MPHQNKFATITTSAILLLCESSLSVAQQNTSQTQAQELREKLEEVVVTGSRIKRVTNENSVVPIKVISNDTFDELGALDLSEILAEIPGVSEGLTGRNTNSSIQNAGLSTIELRRLGDDRTLVLINGKRTVSNSGNSDRISLSTIPTGILERTEVTTGGASAIYGSDAIAGVVNFTIENDFEGFELEQRYSSPQASGGEEIRIDSRWGNQYAGGRGYFILSGAYNDRKMIRADKTRPKSIQAIEFDDPADDPRDSFANELNQPGCDPNNADKHCLLPSFSGSTPGGVFEGDVWNVDGKWFNDKGLQPGDRTGSQDFLSDFDGYNFRPGRTLINAREIVNVGAYTTFEFNPETQGSLLLLHTDIDTLTATGFESLNDDDEFGPTEERSVGNIASDHPFIPQEVEATRSGSVSFDRRLVELGEQQRINNRQVTRLITDLDGSFSDTLDWNIFATYGHFSQKNQTTNEVNFVNAKHALDIASDGNGNFQCTDAKAREQGCVPLNIFGEGSISKAAADYIRYNGAFTQVRDQYTAGASINADLFTLPSGRVKAVFGVEFRREEQETKGDPDANGGLDGNISTKEDNFITSLTGVATFGNDYEVTEAFTEIELPLSDNISLNVAGRVADYTTVGVISSWSVGAMWQPSEQFSLRSQLSRAQRAPNLAEFFSPPRPDNDDLEDPCEGLRVTGVDKDGNITAFGGQLDALLGDGAENADNTIRRKNCIADKAVNAFFTNAIEEAKDELRDQTPPKELSPKNILGELTAFNTSSSVNSPNSGNQKLKEETADTFTIGAIIKPYITPGVTIAIDYYSIAISDVIDAVTTQNLVEQCYTAASYPNNPFCKVIKRNKSNGEVTEVINTQENLNEREVEGIDISVNWDFKLPNIVGEWGLDLSYSRYLKDDLLFLGLGGVELKSTNLGEIDSAENEFKGTFGYKSEHWRFRYTLSYEQGGVDNVTKHPLPTNNKYFKTPAEFFHRVYTAYTFGKDNKYRLFGGIDNITNNFGPVLPDGLDNGGSRNITSDINDIEGRTFFLGFRYRI